MRPQEAGSSGEDAGTGEQQQRVDGLTGAMDGLGGLVYGFFFLVFVFCD